MSETTNSSTSSTQVSRRLRSCWPKPRWPQLAVTGTLGPFQLLHARYTPTTHAYSVGRAVQKRWLHGGTGSASSPQTRRQKSEAQTSTPRFFFIHTSGTPLRTLVSIFSVGQGPQGSGEQTDGSKNHASARRTRHVLGLRASFKRT